MCINYAPVGPTDLMQFDHNLHVICALLITSIGIKSTYSLTHDV